MLEKFEQKALNPDKNKKTKTEEKTEEIPIKPINPINLYTQSIKKPQIIPERMPNLEKLLNKTLIFDDYFKFANEIKGKINYDEYQILAKNNQKLDKNYSNMLLLEENKLFDISKTFEKLTIQ